MSTHPEHLHEHGQLSEGLHFVDDAEYILQSGEPTEQIKLLKVEPP